MITDQLRYFNSAKDRKQTSYILKTYEYAVCTRHVIHVNDSVKSSIVYLCMQKNINNTKKNYSPN